MKRLSTVFLVAFVGLLAGLGGFVAWRVRERPAPPPVAAPPAKADNEIKEVHIDETLEGSLRWTLDADQAEVYDPERRTILRKVVVHVFSKDGSWTVTADQGSMQNESHDVVLEGHVVARSSEGVEIKTERLAWRNSDRVLSSDVPVQIVQAGTTITAQALAVALADQRALLEREVRVVITNRSNANLSIFPRSGS